MPTLWIPYLPTCPIGFTLASLHICCHCSVTQSCPTRCNPVDCSMTGFPVLHHLLEFAQTHVHWINDAIQSFHPLSSPPPSALNLSQHQGLLQWVGSSHQVAKVLQLQHQSFQWILISNPERWCCESAALNMSANLENSAVATGLEKVSFHSNPKERQCKKNAQATTQLHSSHMLVK